jgi:hypothetical protein
MSALGALAFGLSAGAAVGISALFPLERVSGQIVFLFSSLLFGGLVADLLLARHGWLTLVGLIPSLSASIYWRRRHHSGHNLLDAPLSPQGRVEAEILLETMRQNRRTKS